jgi:ATP-dependent Lon protease
MNRFISLDSPAELQSIPNATLDTNGLIQCAVLPLRDMILYPSMVTPLLIGRERSLAVLSEARQKHETVIAIAQIDLNVEEPTIDDLYRVGVEIAIGRLLRMPDGTNSALVETRRRVQIVEVLQTEPYLRVSARPIVVTAEKTPEVEALQRVVLALFEKCSQLSRDISEEAYVYAMNIEDPSWLADMIAATIAPDLVEQQTLLEIPDPMERLQRVSILLGRELNVLEIEDKIHSQVQQKVEQGQRDLYLREQMRAIQAELGEQDTWAQEINELREKVVAAGMPTETHQRAMKELERLEQMPPLTPETAIIRTYLEWLIELPWWKASTDNFSIRNAQKMLDQFHFGLEKVKDRILEYIAVRSLAKDKNTRQPILCFVGPPGTGKTSLGKAIANALGREFVRVSLGGVRDESEIRGHRRTYIGALPGRVLQTMRRAGTVNPLFMLDEIDKLGADFRGDPSSALLEVLDPEQNNAFSDHYLEVPYDLSKVMFVTTANGLWNIPLALEDRLEVIEFSGYTEQEKLEIAKKFLLPRQLEQNNLKAKEVHLPDNTIMALIRHYTYEAGVRELERQIATVLRKQARRKAERKTFTHEIAPEMLTELLGAAEHTELGAEQDDAVGVATGLAWTENGGDILQIEVALMPGRGEMILTGQLGQVMQESARAALSYIRAHCGDFGLKAKDFEKVDIHLHCPEGAIAKDGPSAGITITTALASAFSNRAVRCSTIGMTGEVTLRGRVLPIGGLREKLLAAGRNGLTTVIIPKKNEKDLADIPEKIRAVLEIKLVSHVSEVFELALHPAAAPKPRVKRPRKPKATVPETEVAAEPVASIANS